MKKSIAFTALLCGVVLGLGAQVQDATVLGLLVSSLPEAKLDLNQSWTIPLLRGDGFLTGGNGLKTALDFYVTPVSMSAGADFTFTPIAFAQIRGGASAASGWNVPGLAPDAWGINAPDGQAGSIAGKIEGGPFDAVVWKAYGGLVFQFDTGAVIPGEWTHVQFQTYQQFFYRARTGAASGESWAFENDGGENQNGFKYYSSYTIAYQLPAASPVFRTLAVQAELEWKLYNSPGGGAWGEDLPWCVFSALANFEITPRCGLALVAQLSYDRNYHNWQRRVSSVEEVYYRNRELVTEDGNEMNLNFYRFACVLTFRLR